MAPLILPPPFDPTAYKDQLRARRLLVPVARCYTEAIEQATRFWALYEQVNRDYLPDDPVYSVSRAGTALSTTADAITLQTPASAAQGRVLEIIIGGEATASAVNRVAIARNTTLGVTGSSPQTPEKFNSRSAAAQLIFNTAWTTQPVLSSVPYLTFAFNAFGGFIDWKAAPGEEIYLVFGSAAEGLSERSLSGTSIVSSTLIFEEL